MARFARCRFLFPLAFLALAPFASFAQTASFNLPAAPLAESLKAIGAQTNLNVLVTPALVDGKQAPALNAKLSVKDALGRLLEGSGLEYHFINDQTVVIREKTVAANDPPAQKKRTADTEKETGKNSSQDFRVAQVDQRPAESNIPVGPSANSKPKSDGLEEIVVTGSRLHSQPSAAAVQVVTADDMAREGITSLSDAIQRLPASNGILNGNANPGSPVFTATVGASAANLRGLGVGSTLVLLNGRRVVSYGYAADGTSAFVDLNSLPFGAVDRIEVLKSGASAIYGSDAVAGVINVILKPEFSGLRLNADTGMSEHGDARKQHLAGTAGKGNLQEDGYNVLLNVDHTTSDALNFRNRAQTSTADLSRFGLGDWRLIGSPSIDLFDNFGPTANYLGTLFPCSAADTNKNGRCVFDQLRIMQALPAQSKTSVFGTGSLLLGTVATLYSEVGYSRTDTKLAMPPSDLTLFLLSRTFFGNSAPVTWDFPGSTTNPAALAYDVLSDFGNRSLEITSSNDRAVLGVRGNLGEWSWDLNGTWNRGEATQAGQNFVRGFALIDAVLGNTSPVFPLQPNGVPTAEERAAYAPPFENRSRATMSQAQVSLTGPIYHLPAGDIKIAAGAEVRKESINLVADPHMVANDYTDFEVIQSVQDSRDVRSAYAEAGVPLLQGLIAQLAVRYDQYTKAAMATRSPGSATSGLLGLRYEPASWLVVRGTYEQGFRAPSLFETSVKTVGAEQVQTYDPVRCPVTGAPTDCQAVNGATGSNPDLKPVKSRSESIGVELKPIDRLEITLDLFKIKLTDDIASPTPAFLFANETSYPDRVVRGPPDIAGLPGPVTFLDLRYLNIGESNVRGIDGSVRYGVHVDPLGDLRSSLDATYIDQSNQIASPGAPTDAVAGFYNNPRFRSTASVGIDRGAFSSTLSAVYTSGFKQAQNSQSQCDFLATFPKACNIGSFTTVNWTSSYHVTDRVTVGLSIDNLFDAKPPFDITLMRFVNTSFSDIRGRYLTLQAQAAF